MKIIYRAADGVEFETESECLMHEKVNDIVMYDERGKRTHNVDDAIVVHLKNFDQVIVFQQMNDGNELTPGGIYDHACGWFYWDWDCCRYRWIDPELLNILRTIDIND